MHGRWRVGLALAMALAVAACGREQTSGAGATGPIRVGHFASLTGDTATFGRSTDNGIRMKIEEVNARGGVLGRPLELVTEDDRSITEEARTTAQKLVQRDEVVALLGEVASSRSLAAAPEAQRARIPMISPASTNPRVTQVGDYVFRACFIDPFQGAVMAKFARETIGAKRVAILFDFKQDYSVGLADFFRKTFQSMGGEIVADERYTSGDIEFRAQLTKIRGTRPDAIFVPGYYTEAGLIAKQARELGITVPLLGGDGWDSTRTLEIGGSAVEGDFFSNHYAADSDSALVREFVEKYRAKYGEVPDAMAVLGYDAAGILVDALARAGTTDGPKLRDAIAATKDYPGVSGTISMDPQRNARKDAVVIEIKDGGFHYKQTVPAF
ncbi:MAG: ABC transporter substrate-binding protein [Deltaproteobacteria bacterium]|nr:ABC transporter substrate-binding protein [Deltaproteobacteria bacterium]